LRGSAAAYRREMIMSDAASARPLWEDRPMGVALTVQRYIFSHYFYSGIGVACGVLGIALTAYSLFGLSIAAAVSTGALAVSIADVPRTVYLKRVQLTSALVLTIIVTLLIGLSQASDLLQGAVILLISFGAAMLLAYGKESLPASMAVLIMMAIALGTPAPDVAHILQHTGLFALGGSIYLGYALTLSILLRFRTKQQALAECLYEFARYLKTKANFYDTAFELDATYRAMVKQQAVMNERLQAARDLVFRALRSDRDGQLASTLIAMLDVHEHILAAQTDYEVLREHFAGSDVLLFLRDLALKSAQGLEQISFAILRDREPRSAVNYKAELFAIGYELNRLGKAEQRSAADEQALATLTEIYETIRQSIAHIERLHAVARTPVAPGEVLGGADLKRFVNRIDLSTQLLVHELRADSPIFRYALRTTMAMGCGYLLADILPYAAHSQWILLTLAVIMRPTFSLTKQRRTDRVVGNAIGCALTACVLHFSPGPGVIFAGLFLSLAVAHTFAPIKYRYTAVAACVMALLQLHLLSPTAPFAVGERLVDTVVGALLAYGFSFVLPHWEFRELPRLAASQLEAALKFASATLTLPPQDMEYRLMRKRFNDSIGILSTTFGRMLEEPASHRFIKSELNSLITQNYLLAAHLTAVKVLLQRRVNSIDPERTMRLIDAARGDVASELGAAIRRLCEPTAAPPQYHDAPLPRDATPPPWSVESSLEHRLDSIREDARKIRALSGAIAAPRSGS
jgi:uncharacterized membrane protein YccC